MQGNGPSPANAEEALLLSVPVQPTRKSGAATGASSNVSPAAGVDQNGGELAAGFRLNAFRGQANDLSPNRRSLFNPDRTIRGQIPHVLLKPNRPPNSSTGPAPMYSFASPSPKKNTFIALFVLRQKARFPLPHKSLCRPNDCVQITQKPHKQLEFASSLSPENRNVSPGASCGITFFRNRNAARWRFFSNHFHTAVMAKSAKPQRKPSGCHC